MDNGLQTGRGGLMVSMLSDATLRRRVSGWPRLLCCAACLTHGCACDAALHLSLDIWPPQTLLGRHEWDMGTCSMSGKNSPPACSEHIHDRHSSSNVRFRTCEKQSICLLLAV